jgi:lactoylglutathione lyase
MTKYLHTIVRVTDPQARIRLFELIDMNVVRRMENERAAIRSFSRRLRRI